MTRLGFLTHCLRYHPCSQRLWTHTGMTLAPPRLDSKYSIVIPQEWNDLGKFNTAVLNHGGIQILSRQYPRWCKKLTIFQSSTFNIHHFLPTELPWTYFSFLLLCLLPVFMSRPWASLEFGMMPTTLNQSRGKFLHLCHSWRQWGLKHSIPILITIWFSC